MCIIHSANLFICFILIKLVRYFIYKLFWFSPDLVFTQFIFVFVTVLEGTPETLVQGVPSALSEIYSQNLNGQMSDVSNHEDQSEPTVATLSSEATGEMDVSSLDDKSQAETHVEKRGVWKIFKTFGMEMQMWRNSSCTLTGYGAMLTSEILFLLDNIAWHH